MSAPLCHRLLRSTICFFLPTLLLSQIIIREKVEIKPQPLPRSVQGALPIRVESSFDGGVDPNLPQLIWLNGPCTVDVASGNISGTLTAPAYDGAYKAGYRFTNPAGGTGGQFRFAVYVGDSLVREFRTPVGCPTGCTLFSEWDIRVYAGFTFWPQSAVIGSGGTNTFGAVESTSTVPCSPGMWMSEWPIELEITKGRDVGSFVDGGKRTYLVVKKKGEFSTFGFLADGGKGYGDVEITARSGGITVVKGIKVVAPAPRVHIVPPWWWYGQPIKLSFDNLPILEFGETHTPGPGQKFEPLITWEPDDTINTADYFNQVNELYVKVKAENAGGVARDSVKLVFQTECIKVNFDPSELSPGDTARLSFQRVKEDGTLENLAAGSYTFSVMIVGGADSSRGLFVTEEEEPEGGTTLLYASAPILYIAPARPVNGASIPDTSMKVQVLAAAWEVIWGKIGDTKNPKAEPPEVQAHTQVKGPTAKPAKPAAKETVFLMGSCPISEVVVKRDIVLKIQDHSPWSIWPYLPAQRKGESRGADRPGYNPERGFKIRVVDGSNQPVKDEEVKVFTTFREHSGGHQHGLGDPTLPQGIKQGVLYGQKKQANPITLLTDQDGFAVVDSFIASQISGKYLITASLASDPTVKDTVNLDVKVQGLVNFRDLVVLNERPFVFAQSDIGQANHPDNTWCAPEMGDSLFLAILDFYEWSRTPRGGGRAIQTSINDMSLVWGGLFDLGADWNIERPSHSFHRVGLSVDINMGVMSGDHLDNSS
jgi:hypothetical protein